jgi:PAS domain S-box-containing protein
LETFVGTNESEDRYKRLVQFLTDYIYTVKIDDTGLIETYHGPGCVRVTGYTSEDYYKDPELWVRMVFKEDRKTVTEQATMALSGKPVNPLEHRIIHRNGSIRWVKNSIVLSIDENGILKGYDGLINDITNIKKAEQQSVEKQKQLEQADKLASLGVLVSGVAHEINNPNNYIMLNVQLFSKIWKDILPILNSHYENNGDFALAGMSYSQSIEKITKSIDGIENGSERIKNIVNALTNFAKQDRGDLNQEVDINKVVDFSILITGTLIKKSTDYFNVEYSDNLPKIKGNMQQLEQVLINLVTNSCQSLKKRNEKILVRTYKKESNNSVSISIEDEGGGMTDDMLKHIFDPFFTTKRTSGGTGLGLSISYNIIQNHEGTLSFHSEIGKGTKAIVSLPLQ